MNSGIGECSERVAAPLSALLEERDGYEVARSSTGSTTRPRHPHRRPPV